MTVSRDYDWDDYDWCYECEGYGDDYYIDDNGEMVSACNGCIHNMLEVDDE